MREGHPSVPGQTWRPSAMISPGGGSGSLSGGGVGGDVGGEEVPDDREAVYKRGRQSPGVMSGGVVGAVGTNPLASRPPALRPEEGVHRRVGRGFASHPPTYGPPPSSAASTSGAAGAAAAGADASAATSLPAVSFSRYRGGAYGSRFNTSHSVCAALVSSLEVVPLFTSAFFSLYFQIVWPENASAATKGFNTSYRGRFLPIEKIGSPYYCATVQKHS